MKRRGIKRLTRAQKIILFKHDARYNPDKWYCIGDTPQALTLLHRETGKQIVINK